jgi:hypothetical protein
MMTHADIASEYQINEHGTIVSPGKFEGEPVYAVALYDLVMDGASDESAGPADLITVDADLRAAFPSIPADVVAFVVWTSDVGFFNVHEHTSIAEAEADLSGWDDTDAGDDE